MSTSGYRKEQKYEEVDEDKLLATLSSEELQELERELLVMDDNIPIGMRQKDQTAKTPTGTFDRDALRKYWEDENKKFTKDETTESNTGQEGRPEKIMEEQATVTSSSSSKTLDSDRKKTVPKGRKTQAKDDEKKDECKKEAQIRSKCPQKNGLSKGFKCDTKRTETTNQNPDRPSGNPTVIAETLEKILTDDPTVTEVNLNNIEDISQDNLLRFAEALCTNTHVHVFSLANTHADDRVAFAISKMLCENHSIKNLNIESNFVSGQGILALLAALQFNRTLVELRFHNQRHICGGKVEMEMVQLLRENTTLLKLGYQFDLPGPRMTATSILTRNQDQHRQRRLQQKKDQSPPDGSGQGSGSSSENKPPKKPTKNVENQKRNPPPPPPPQDQPTRTIAEMVKQQEGSNITKNQANQKKPKSKKLKNGANERESADILKELRNSLKPSLQKRRAEPSHLPPPQRSSRDDLMAAIRGSSIMSLKRMVNKRSKWKLKNQKNFHRD